MNKITSPLIPRMQGPQVADLQDALGVLLNRVFDQANDEASRRELAAALQREHAQLSYGEGMGWLVSESAQAWRGSVLPRRQTGWLSTVTSKDCHMDHGILVGADRCRSWALTNAVGRRRDSEHALSTTIEAGL